MHTRYAANTHVLHFQRAIPPSAGWGQPSSAHASAINCDNPARAAAPLQRKCLTNGTVPGAAVTPVYHRRSGGAGVPAGPRPSGDETVPTQQSGPSPGHGPTTGDRVTIGIVAGHGAPTGYIRPTAPVRRDSRTTRGTVDIY